MRFIWTKIMNISGKFIYRDDANPSLYNKICSDCIDQSIKTFIMIISSEGLSFVIANIEEFYSLLNGQKITLMSLRLPYLNQYPDTEYLITYFFEIFGSSNGFCSFIAIEIGFTYACE